jgi:integrase
MARGSIRRRGASSWSVKFDVPAENGKRQTRYVTVRGDKKDAQRELTRMLAQVDAGTFVDPEKMTVREYIVAWLGERPKSKEQKPPAPPAGISPKTAERYRDLAEDQIYPHLGSTALQKLKPAQVADWHDTLLKAGGKTGKPLAPRTVGHAHRVLHRALERAVKRETLHRNVAGVMPPPKVDEDEVEILQDGEIPLVIEALHEAEHALHPIADLVIATGLRRGEVSALQWASVDLDACRLKVERAVEETRQGLRIKPPKTKNSRRSLTFPASTAAVLREHRKKQLELRMALGLGKQPADALVFCQPDGSLIKPSWLSYTWRNTRQSMELPDVTFHAFRHTHASALIAAGLDVVAISRRMGHSSPVVTLRIYGHLFKKDDSGAAAAIEAVMRTQRQPK